MCPARTPATAPSAAPSAMPNPVCFDLLAIIHSNASLRSAGQARRLSLREQFLLAIHYRRLRRLIANLPHFPEQFRQRHAGKRFEQRRHLRRHLGDVAGDLVHSRGIAVSSRDDGNLVDLRQRTGQRPHHLRHRSEQTVNHRRLVVFLISLGFHVHGLGFSFAFLEDNLGLSLALRAYRRSMPFRFRDQALLFGRSESFDPLPIDFRRFQHSCDQFFLAAVVFRLPAFHPLLFFDLLPPYLLSNSLLLPVVVLA